MILPCTSPPNAIYANMKARKLDVARPVRLFWPLIKDAGQYGQTRPHISKVHMEIATETHCSQSQRVLFSGSGMTSYAFTTSSGS